MTADFTAQIGFTAEQYLATKAALENPEAARALTRTLGADAARALQSLVVQVAAAITTAARGDEVYVGSDLAPWRVAAVADGGPVGTIATLTRGDDDPMVLYGDSLSRATSLGGDPLLWLLG